MPSGQHHTQTFGSLIRGLMLKQRDHNPSLEPWSDSHGGLKPLGGVVFIEVGCLITTHSSVDILHSAAQNHR